MRTKKQKQEEFEGYEADLQEEFPAGSARDPHWRATLKLTSSIDSIEIYAEALKHHERLGSLVRKYTYDTKAILVLADQIRWLAGRLMREARTMQKHQARRSAMIRYAHRGPRALLTGRQEVAA